MATSGSEKTAGRSRLTSNRRFASGRRPGWLRPRKVSLSHTSASRSSLRPSRRPGDRPPTGVSSCRSTTTATSCKPRPTNYTRSIFTASESCPTRAAEAPGMANSDTVRDDTRKTPPQGDPQRLGEPPPNSQNAQSRCSRAVRQPGERCGSAIDRAIPPSTAFPCDSTLPVTREQFTDIAPEVLTAVTAFIQEAFGSPRSAASASAKTRESDYSVARFQT